MGLLQPNPASIYVSLAGPSDIGGKYLGAAHAAMAASQILQSYSELLDGAYVLIRRTFSRFEASIVHTKLEVQTVVSTFAE
jgi:hypothetical protein